MLATSSADTKLIGLSPEPNTSALPPSVSLAPIRSIQVSRKWGWPDDRPVQAAADESLFRGIFHAVQAHWMGGCRTVRGHEDHVLDPVPGCGAEQGDVGVAVDGGRAGTAPPGEPVDGRDHGRAATERLGGDRGTAQVTDDDVDSGGLQRGSAARVTG